MVILNLYLCDSFSLGSIKKVTLDFTMKGELLFFVPLLFHLYVFGFSYSSMIIFFGRFISIIMCLDIEFMII